jgi:TolB-like protein/Flp pilus assembly protein TadD
MALLPQDRRMDRVVSAENILFEGFRLDRRGGCLFRLDQDGAGTPVSLGSRALELLRLLVDRTGELVSKDEIMKTVWPGRVVEETNLNVQIAKLRHVLDQHREHGSCIRTISGRGYCFVGTVRQAETHATIASTAVASLQRSLTALALPDRPSIAVLPFVNMSTDPEQEYFADGIAEDIITAMSRYPSVFVIARSSCFAYKGRAVEVKQVGRELGVRYVLEGALRKFGNRIRVTAQLVEAETGTDLWAERYERDLADIFAVQDEITEAGTIAIAPAIADAELRRAMRRSPESLDAWAANQRGFWHLSKATPNDDLLAEKYFQQAMDLDPNFSGGYRGLAFTQNQTLYFRGRGVLEGLNSIEALARRAVALDPADAEARSCLGMALYKRADYEGALAEIEYALVTSPNLAIAHGIFGATLVFSGCPKQGIAALERNMRLDPRDPQLAVRLNQIALAHYFSREYANAVEVAKRTMRSYPDYPHIYRWLAAALGHLGRTDEAREALEKAISTAPVAFDMFVRQGAPWIRPEDHAHMLEGLRKAGMPEAERCAPQRQRKRLISAATWLTWPQLGAGDEVWDFLRAAIAAAVDAR